MSQWILRLATVAVTALVAILAGRVYSAQLIKPVPVTVVVKWDSFDSAGKHRRTRTKVVAIRGDGSQVDAISLTSPEGVSFDNRLIQDWATQRKIGFLNVAKSKSTTNIDPAEFAALTKARISCAADPNRERTMYRGHVVVKDTERFMRGDGEYIRESLLAPGLNCLELQRITTSRLHNGQTVLRTRIETEVVALGDPDPALFEIPKEYVERAWGDVVNEAARALGLPPRANR